MARARLTIYHTNLRREVRRRTIEPRVAIANDIANDARAAAPVLTGAYRAGISVETNGDMVSVIDTDADSIYKEYGTSDTPAHAALTNAAMNYGRYSGMRPRR